MAANVWLVELLVTTNHRREAESVLYELKELAPRVEEPFSHMCLALFDLLLASWDGRFAEGVATFERWQGTGGQRLPATLMEAYLRRAGSWIEALGRAGRGEYQRALALLEDTLASYKRIGDVLMPMRILNTLGWIYGEIQAYERAMECNQQAVHAAQEVSLPDPEVESNARLNLGDNLLALGRLDEAEAHFQWVEQVARRPQSQDHFMLWRYAQHCFHSSGELWLARGDHEKALGYANDCLQLAEESESRKNIIKARRLRGQVFLAQGRLPEAEQELTAALGVAQEVGNPPQLWKTWAALGDLQRVQGNHEQARRAYREALTVIDDVASGLTDEHLRQTLLASREVQRLREAVQASGS
jgi:tetratricopeptide (TPR) repeat protein